MAEDEDKEKDEKIKEAIKKEGNKAEPGKEGLAKIRERTKAAERGNGKKKGKK